MAILLDRFLEVIQYEYKKKEPIWTSVSKLTSADYTFLEKECRKDSEFDPLNARKIMWDRFQSGKAPCEIKECEYGRVVVIYDREEQKQDLPWGLWGRIVRLYTEKRKSSTPFRIYFLASPHLRLFPKRWFNHPHHWEGDIIHPLHINGGYTYPCNHETIMIYRAEDATRVLLHELMHSCCLDKVELGIDQVEAETEAWAELVYAGFLSKGRRGLFRTLVIHQSDWMQVQNRVVEIHTKKPKDFPWRYTIGKEEVWARWGILHPFPSVPLPQAEMSLRLTYPPTDAIKQQFGVRPESTIL
jgi:hypothetical protein